MKGAVRGGITGALSLLPKAWISGLGGSAVAVLALLGNCKRLNRKPSAGEVISTVKGGWQAGVSSHAITRYLLLGDYKHMINSTFGAYYGAYLTAW